MHHVDFFSSIFMVRCPFSSGDNFGCVRLNTAFWLPTSLYADWLKVINILFTT